MLRGVPTSSNDAHAGFTWAPPERYNMAAATVGRATSDLALLHCANGLDAPPSER